MLFEILELIEVFKQISRGIFGLSIGDKNITSIVEDRIVAAYLRED